jgi:hypothetical protein
MASSLSERPPEPLGELLEHGPLFLERLGPWAPRIQQRVQVGDAAALGPCRGCQVHDPPGVHEIPLALVLAVQAQRRDVVAQFPQCRTPEVLPTET